MKQKHILKVDTMPTVDEFKSSTWTNMKPYVGLVDDNVVGGVVFYNYEPDKPIEQNKLPDGYVWAKDSDFNKETDNPWYGAWHYVGKDDKVAIPHIINGEKVTSYRGMFYDTSVSGVYNNNKNITDMSYMFYGSLAIDLDLTYLDTSKVTDMSSMFHASEATTLDLSGFNTSNVTNMQSMFFSSQATSLDLSSFDTMSVTNMDSMFYASKATTLNLSSFDTSSVTNMGAMFFNSKVISLDLSSFNTSRVTNMSSMFHASESTSLNLSSFDTSSVTNMGAMFSSSKATILDLSSFNTSRVTNMSGMFFGSKASICYARTQEDADKLNSSSDKPSTITFLVKQ